jgi:dienelactone hydrolase
VTTPLLMHLGQSDDWTPMRFCEALSRGAVNAGGNITRFVYPGAHHGFDQPGGEVRERRLPSGRVVHSGPDAPSRALAVARTMDFLAAALKPNAR